MSGTTTLLDMIKISISDTVPNSKIGIAFSGGVDSSLLSKICSDMKYDITLLTIGFTGSHDILFAKKINEFLLLPHHTLEIDSNTFQDISRKISQTINTSNLSWIENCIAFYYVSKLAQSLGINTIVTANGIDELFCGYNAYREIFSGGDTKILEAMNAKLENEINMLTRVNLISSKFNVNLVQPFLTTSFIEYSKTIPIQEKIHNSGDLLRKHIIRRLACQVGVPKLSYMKRKKAFQYGSKIHRNLLKVR